MPVKPVEQDLVSGQITVSSVATGKLDQPDLTTGRFQPRLLFPDLVDREVPVFLRVDHQDRSFGQRIDQFLVHERADSGNGGEGSGISGCGGKGSDAPARRAHEIDTTL